MNESRTDKQRQINGPWAIYYSSQMYFPVSFKQLFCLKAITEGKVKQNEFSLAGMLTKWLLLGETLGS